MSPPPAGRLTVDAPHLIGPDTPIGDAETSEAAGKDTGWARQDLDQAVEAGLAVIGGLLSAGELVVVRRYLSASEPARSLVARLLGRKPRVFHVAELRYGEVPDPTAAVAELVSVDLALAADRCCPVGLLLAPLRVPALRAACRALDLPTTGRRDELEARLQHESAREAVAAPALLPLHQGLFRRLCRAWLCDHDGDLSRLVVARLGYSQPARYPPTRGAGVHPDRRAMRAYERARRERWTLDAAALVASSTDRLTRLRFAQPPAPWRYRFSAYRFDVELLLEAARLVAAAGDHHAAQPLFEGLLAVLEPGTARAEAAHRGALNLVALGDVDAAIAVCANERALAPPHLAQALERTGRRLARAERRGWSPLPPLQAARVRRLPLAVGPRPAGSARPSWLVRGQAHTVEDAVVATLGALGRTALHVEGALWRTLTALLVADLMFLPVAGMLPAPLMRAPLDWGEAGFVDRRSAAVAARLAEMGRGEAPRVLAANIEARSGEAIADVDWSLAPLLPAVAAAMGGEALSSIVDLLLRAPADRRQGWPDLLVLPGPAIQLPGALPATVGPDLLFAEIKGPTDTLRDAQRVWMDRLATVGLRVEVWQIEEEAVAGHSPASPT
jgi:SAP domain/VRR-NUC domain